jgi:hypothetical protein
LFSRTLIIQLADVPRTAECIAAVMAGILMKQDMTLKFQLPNQMDLATRLSISKSVVREIWALLVKKYRIIRTKRGVGTFRVDGLTAVQIKRNREAIMQALSSDSKAMLDSPYLLSLGKNLDSRINYALRLCSTKSHAELSLHVLENLLVLFARFCSSLMSYAFQSQEVCYCRSYSGMLTKACEVWCAANHKVVVMTPVSKIVKKAFRNANRKLLFTEWMTSRNALIALEECCKYHQVGVVYFGPTIPFPALYEPDVHFWEQLKQLQQMYGFIIMIDNPTPGKIKVPDLLKGLEAGANNSVVIITKPSTHFLLREINIIAGPGEGILRFQRKFCEVEPLASPSLTYGLLYLLDGAHLPKQEFKAYEQVDQLVQAVKIFLIKEGIFNVEYLEKQQAWYFYLEPQKGALPRNYYKKLNELNLAVCNPRHYGSVTGLTGGIMISVGFYADKNQVLKNIGKLLNAIISI